MIGNLTVATPHERLFAYKNSNQICAVSGFIGHLRGNFAYDDKFYSDFTDGFYKNNERVKGFSEEFDRLMNVFRGIIPGNKALIDFCRKMPSAKFKGLCYEEYCLVDKTEKFVYIIRLIPVEGEYNVYIHCYIRSMFDEFIKRSEKGIRFINSNYRELFRIPDGGRIIIKTGIEEFIRTCRYIDDYHVQIDGLLYHICEFAEKMENNKAKYMPYESEENKNGNID